MNDIVAELKAGADDFCADGPCWPGDVMIEAAMEIERLRAENAEKETMLLNQAKTIKEMQASHEARDALAWMQMHMPYRYYEAVRAMIQVGEIK